MHHSLPMKLLLLTDDLEIGGVPRHVTLLANGLYSRGIEVVVAAIDGPLRESLECPIPFIPLHTHMPTERMKKIALLSYSLFPLIHVVQSHRITIIHTHKRFSDLLGRIIARITGTIHLSTCHSLFNNLHHCSIFGDNTIAISARINQELVGSFHKKVSAVRTILPGVPALKPMTTYELVEKRMELGLSARNKVIACVARLSPEKDHRSIIEAIRMNADILRREHAVVLFVGDGERKQLLAQRIVEQKLSDIIRFLPSSISFQPVGSLADFFILASFQEGLPLTLLEAGSLGKAHIATNVGGISEFITHFRTGILVPPQDPPALASAIQFLLEHPEEAHRLGSAAKKKNEECFGYDRCIDETIEYYQSIITTGRGLSK
ncbi:MAG: glycosyltransferase family 4 protein [bacterium]